MLLINHILKRLQKRPVEAHVGHPLHQPTASFRQEACGFTEAVEYSELDRGVELLICSPTIDPREPVVADIWDYTNNHFLFSQRD